MGPHTQQEGEIDGSRPKSSLGLPLSFLAAIQLIECNTQAIRRAGDRKIDLP